MVAADLLTPIADAVSVFFATAQPDGIPDDLPDFEDILEKLVESVKALADQCEKRIALFSLSPPTSADTKVVDRSYPKIIQGRCEEQVVISLGSELKEAAGEAEKNLASARENCSEACESIRKAVSAGERRQLAFETKNLYEACKALLASADIYRARILGLTIRSFREECLPVVASRLTDIKQDSGERAPYFLIFRRYVLVIVGLLGSLLRDSGESHTGIVVLQYGIEGITSLATTILAKCVEDKEVPCPKADFVEMARLLEKIEIQSQTIGSPGEGLQLRDIQELRDDSQETRNVIGQIEAFTTAEIRFRQSISEGVVTLDDALRFQDSICRLIEILFRLCNGSWYQGPLLRFLTLLFAHYRAILQMGEPSQGNLIYKTGTMGTEAMDNGRRGLHLFLLLGLHLRMLEIGIRGLSRFMKSSIGSIDQAVRAAESVPVEMLREQWEKLIGLVRTLELLDSAHHPEPGRPGYTIVKRLVALVPIISGLRDLECVSNESLRCNLWRIKRSEIERALRDVLRWALVDSSMARRDPAVLADLIRYDGFLYSSAGRNHESQKQNGKSRLARWVTFLTPYVEQAKNSGSDHHVVRALRDVTDELPTSDLENGDTERQLEVVGTLQGARGLPPVESLDDLKLHVVEKIVQDSEKTSGVGDEPPSITPSVCQAMSRPISESPREYPSKQDAGFHEGGSRDGARKDSPRAKKATETPTAPVSPQDRDSKTTRSREGSNSSKASDWSFIDAPLTRPESEGDAGQVVVGGEMRARRGSGVSSTEMSPLSSDSSEDTATGELGSHATYCDLLAGIFDQGEYDSDESSGDRSTWIGSGDLLSSPGGGYREEQPTPGTTKALEKAEFDLLSGTEFALILLGLMEGQGEVESNEVEPVREDVAKMNAIAHVSPDDVPVREILAETLEGMEAMPAALTKGFLPKLRAIPIDQLHREREMEGGEIARYVFEKNRKVIDMLISKAQESCKKMNEDIEALGPMEDALASVRRALEQLSKALDRQKQASRQSIRRAKQAAKPQRRSDCERERAQALLQTLHEGLTKLASSDGSNPCAEHATEALELVHAIHGEPLRLTETIAGDVLALLDAFEPLSVEGETGGLPLDLIDPHLMVKTRECLRGFLRPFARTQRHLLWKLELVNRSLRSASDGTRTELLNKLRAVPQSQTSPEIEGIAAKCLSSLLHLVQVGFLSPNQVLRRACRILVDLERPLGLSMNNGKLKSAALECETLMKRAVDKSAPSNWPRVMEIYSSYKNSVTNPAFRLANRAPDLDLFGDSLSAAIRNLDDAAGLGTKPVAWGFEIEGLKAIENALKAGGDPATSLGWHSEGVDVRSLTMNEYRYLLSALMQLERRFSSEGDSEAEHEARKTAEDTLVTLLDEIMLTGLLTKDDVEAICRSFISKVKWLEESGVSVDEGLRDAVREAQDLLDDLEDIQKVPQSQRLAKRAFKASFESCKNAFSDIDDSFAKYSSIAHGEEVNELTSEARKILALCPSALLSAAIAIEDSRGVRGVRDGSHRSVVSDGTEPRGFDRGSKNSNADIESKHHEALLEELGEIQALVQRKMREVPSLELKKGLCDTIPKLAKIRRIIQNELSGRDPKSDPLPDFRAVFDCARSIGNHLCGLIESKRARSCSPSKELRALREVADTFDKVEETLFKSTAKDRLVIFFARAAKTIKRAERSYREAGQTAQPVTKISRRTVKEAKRKFKQFTKYDAPDILAQITMTYDEALFKLLSSDLDPKTAASLMRSHFEGPMLKIESLLADLVSLARPEGFEPQDLDGAAIRTRLAHLGASSKPELRETFQLGIDSKEDLNKNGHALRQYLRATASSQVMSHICLNELGGLLSFPAVPAYDLERVVELSIASLASLRKTIEGDDVLRSGISPSVMSVEVKLREFSDLSRTRSKQEVFDMSDPLPCVGDLLDKLRSIPMTEVVARNADQAASVQCGVAALACIADVLQAYKSSDPHEESVLCSWGSPLPEEVTATAPGLARAFKGLQKRIQLFQRTIWTWTAAAYLQLLKEATEIQDPQCNHELSDILNEVRGGIPRGTRKGTPMETVRRATEVLRLRIIPEMVSRNPLNIPLHHAKTIPMINTGALIHCLFEATRQTGSAIWKPKLERCFREDSDMLATFGNSCEAILEAMRQGRLLFPDSRDPTPTADRTCKRGAELSKLQGASKKKPYQRLVHYDTLSELVESGACESDGSMSDDSTAQGDPYDPEDTERSVSYSKPVSDTERALEIAEFDLLSATELVLHLLDFLEHEGKVDPCKLVELRHDASSMAAVAHISPNHLPVDRVLTQTVNDVEAMPSEISSAILPRLKSVPINRIRYHQEGADLRHRPEFGEVHEALKLLLKDLEGSSAGKAVESKGDICQGTSPQKASGGSAGLKAAGQSLRRALERLRRIPSTDIQTPRETSYRSDAGKNRAPTQSLSAGDLEKIQGTLRRLELQLKKCMSGAPCRSAVQHAANAIAMIQSQVSESHTVTDNQISLVLELAKAQSKPMSLGFQEGVDVLDSVQPRYEDQIREIANDLLRLLQPVPTVSRANLCRLARLQRSFLSANLNTQGTVNSDPESQDAIWDGLRCLAHLPLTSRIRNLATLGQALQSAVKIENSVPWDIPHSSGNDAMDHCVAILGDALVDGDPSHWCRIIEAAQVLGQAKQAIHGSKSVSASDEAPPLMGVVLDPKLAVSRATPEKMRELSVLLTKETEDIVDFLEIEKSKCTRVEDKESMITCSSCLKSELFKFRSISEGNSNRWTQVSGLQMREILTRMAELIRGVKFEGGRPEIDALNGPGRMSQLLKEITRIDLELGSFFRLPASRGSSRNDPEGQDRGIPGRKEQNSGMPTREGQNRTQDPRFIENLLSDVVKAIDGEPLGASPHGKDIDHCLGRLQDLRKSLRSSEPPSKETEFARTGVMVGYRPASVTIDDYQILKNAYEGISGLKEAGSMAIGGAGDLEKALGAIDALLDKVILDGIITFCDAERIAHDFLATAKEQPKNIVDDELQTMMELARDILEDSSDAQCSTLPVQNAKWNVLRSLDQCEDGLRHLLLDTQDIACQDERKKVIATGKSLRLLGSAFVLYAVSGDALRTYVCTPAATVSGPIDVVANGQAQHQLGTSDSLSRCSQSVLLTEIKDTEQLVKEHIQSAPTLEIKKSLFGVLPKIAKLRRVVEQCSSDHPSRAPPKPDFYAVFDCAKTISKHLQDLLGGLGIREIGTSEELSALRGIVDVFDNIEEDLFKAVAKDGAAMAFYRATRTLKNVEKETTNGPHTVIATTRRNLRAMRNRFKRDTKYSGPDTLARVVFALDSVLRMVLASSMDLDRAERIIRSQILGPMKVLHDILAELVGVFRKDAPQEKNKDDIAESRRRFLVDGASQAMKEAFGLANGTTGSGSPHKQGIQDYLRLSASAQDLSHVCHNELGTLNHLAVTPLHDIREALFFCVPSVSSLKLMVGKHPTLNGILSKALCDLEDRLCHLTRTRGVQPREVADELVGITSVMGDLLTNLDGQNPEEIPCTDEAEREVISMAKLLLGSIRDLVSCFGRSSQAATGFLVNDQVLPEEILVDSPDLAKLLRRAAKRGQILERYIWIWAAAAQFEMLRSIAKSLDADVEAGLGRVFDDARGSAVMAAKKTRPSPLDTVQIMKKVTGAARRGSLSGTNGAADISGLKITVQHISRVPMANISALLSCQFRSCLLEDLPKVDRTLQTEFLTGSDHLIAIGYSGEAVAEALRRAVASHDVLPAIPAETASVDPVDLTQAEIATMRDVKFANQELNVIQDTVRDMDQVAQELKENDQIGKTATKITEAVATVFNAIGSNPKAVEESAQVAGGHSDSVQVLDSQVAKPTKAEAVCASKELNRLVSGLLKAARQLAADCSDQRLKRSLLATTEPLPVLAHQLSILVAVDARGEGNPDSEKVLVSCLNNLTQSIAATIKECKIASIRTSYAVETGTNSVTLTSRK